MRRLAATLLLLAVGAPSAHAAIPALIGDGPDGGVMSHLARSGADPRVVFAANETAWKSVDGGGTWAPYGRRIAGHFTDLVVGAGPVDTVLASINGQLV